MNGLKFIRLKYGMSLDDMARKLGVSNPAMSSWENGKKPIPQKRLTQLSSLFDIPEEYFTELSEIQELEINGIIQNAKKTDSESYQISYVNNVQRAKKRLLKKIESTINGEELGANVTIYDDAIRIRNYIELYDMFTDLLTRPLTRALAKKIIYAMDVSLNKMATRYIENKELPYIEEKFVRDFVKSILEYQKEWEERKAERERLIAQWKESDEYEDLY